MKKKVFTISLGIYFFALIFSSCNTLKSKYIKYEDQICDVCFVEIYSMTPMWNIEGDGTPEFSSYVNLITEEEIRTSADFKATLSPGGAQLDCFMAYLYSAEKCDIKSNKVRLKKIDGLECFWQDGIVIDVYYDDIDRDKDIYIMQNGEPVFYKKGEENIYYKMPRQILEKYRFYCDRR